MLFLLFRYMLLNEQSAPHKVPHAEEVQICIFSFSIWHLEQGLQSDIYNVSAILLASDIKLNARLDW